MESKTMRRGTATATPILIAKEEDGCGAQTSNVSRMPERPIPGGKGTVYSLAKSPFLGVLCDTPSILQLNLGGSRRSVIV